MNFAVNAVSPAPISPARRNQSRAFTLIELLVLIAIIAILTALLLPSLNGAKAKSFVAVCASNQRQISLAAITYTLDFGDFMNPLQDVRHGSDGMDDETTYRVVLWDYAGRAPNLFDCPAEKVAVYADGISRNDASFGGFALSPGTAWNMIYGFPSQYEVWNASGIGVAGAHWVPVRNDSDPASRVATMPFGRPTSQGYYEGLHKTVEITNPAKLIWFGDGGSGTATLWSDDSWWIKYTSPGSEDDAGFNRLLQDDYGCTRHDSKANYVFADGHADRLEANKIRCDTGECWWSVRLGAHSGTGR